MTYPKLPDGPSSAGAAASRQLPEGSFQTRRSGEFVARQMGEFSRVNLTDEDEYLTNGLWTSTTVTGVPRSSGNWDDTFAKATTAVNTSDPSTGFYVEMTNVDGGLACSNVQLTTPSSFTPVWTQKISFGDKYDASKAVAFTRTFDHRWYTVLGYTYMRYGMPAYFGSVSIGGTAAKQVGCINMRADGTDAYGHMLLAPWMDYAFSEGSKDSIQLPMPAGVRYYTSNGHRPIVTRSATYVLIFETYYYDPAHGATTAPSAPPPVWMLRSIDNGQTWSTPTNIVGAFPRLGAALALSGADMYETYAASLSSMEAGQVFAVTGDDSFIFCVPYETVLPGYYTGNHYPDMIRVVGGTVSPITFTTDGAQHGLITALVYLGAGKLLATYTHETGTTNYIDFWSSTDGGSTWTQHASPAGFNCPLEHKYMGSNYLLVDEAATTTTDGAALMTAWDQTEGSYFVYRTTDLGTTWTRGGRITAAIDPANHDAVYGDGGYQYDQLMVLASPTSLRDLDPALPGRYTL